ncbi:MAG TPA: periplasmic heavy metal sensor [Polyangia bacterium]|nr:periplasmic heavy metal sensor [Polyangia bacterium]
MHNSSPQNQTNNAAIARQGRRFSRRAALVLAPVLLLGSLTLSAAEREQGGDGGPGMFGHGHGMQMRRFHHMLDVAGATDAQRAQIKAIWEPLRPQLRAAAEEHAKIRLSIRQALVAPTIDAAAIEKLRQEGLAAWDKKSALFTQAMVASAQVLTPDQRQKISAEMQKHAAEHHHNGGGDAL